MKKFQEHLNKWLLLYVTGAMILGLLIGKPSASWVKANQSMVSSLTTVIVFLIIYPMMVNVKLESLAKASKNIKAILLSVIFNFAWAPLFGWLLVKLFLHGDPMLSIGFLLVMVVPCSSMVIGYTGLSDGNIELATVIVALSFVLAIVALPLWMMIFARNYHIVVPINDILKSILTVLIAPMILGYLTRILLTRWLGEKGFKKLQPLFPSLSLIAMYGIVFVIFFSKATMIIDKWQTVLLLLIPNVLFIAISLVLFTWINKKLNLKYEDNMAVVFASTAKNNGTAIAIATMAFSPMVAIPAATIPIFQIIFLVFYLKLAGSLKRYFGERQNLYILYQGSNLKR
jgi:ACR3 family arsenite efflux pump ArsB